MGNPSLLLRLAPPAYFFACLVKRFTLCRVCPLATLEDVMGITFASAVPGKIGTMKAHSKLLILAVVLLPGGVLLLLAPLAKMLWRYASNRHISLGQPSDAVVGR